MAQKSQKLKNPAHIWDEVTEETKSLLIVDYDHNHPGLKRMYENPIRGVTSNRKKMYAEPLIIINLRDYPSDSVKNLKGMPKNLPNLEVFHMR